MRQSQRSGHDRMSGRAGVFGDVDPRPVFPSQLCARHMETSCAFLSPAGTSKARSQGNLGRVTPLQRPPTQPRPRGAV